jgi:Ca2+-binding EF-hand superfamily protein
VAALKSVDLQLSDAQIYELMRTMDLDASGFIDFSEFVSVSRRQVVNLEHLSCSSPSAANPHARLC